MWTIKLLKERFLKFFEKKDHKILPGISVVPLNDPTLLFTNSGMVQFKNIFLGDTPKYPRVCTVQRCIRAGGKHNDLDDVGMDNYHHTFFEMLGNWSFGDYFKEEAIKYAYEFLVEELNIDKNRLYVTVYEELDKDSRNIWRKYIDDSRILNASFKDNFWEMGEYGPCGPCTEIHYDRIGGRDASMLVNKDDPNVIEIWNIVFMEYNRTPEGLQELEIKHVDTGIGCERLLSVLINEQTNYSIDIFRDLISVIESLCFGGEGYKYCDGRFSQDSAVRVVADHARCIAACLNDGVFFSSEGAGYVVRRILRRGVRYANDVLKMEKGDFSKIVQHAADLMDMHVDIRRVNAEEELFMKTLRNGVVRFNKIANEKGKLDGKDVFLLYDTYGFPADLTKVLGREQNVEVSMKGFDECKKRAQELSRGKRNIESFTFDFEKTDDHFKYETNGIQANLKAIITNDSNDLESKGLNKFETTDLIIKIRELNIKNKELNTLQSNDLNDQKDNKLNELETKGSKLEKYTDIKHSIKENISNSEDHNVINSISLVFDKTCFYAEKGGQVGDRGTIYFEDDNGNTVGTFTVENTRVVRGYVLHIGIMLSGIMSSIAKLVYNERLRALTRVNHSVCHILYFYLRKEFPTVQKGSLVDEEKCRFDFEGEKLTDEIIRRVENNMREFVAKNVKKRTKIYSYDEALQRKELVLDEAHYEDGVRVVIFENNGEIIEDVCGGTHVESTAEIKNIRIISEVGIKSNTRRITVLTNERASEAEENAQRLYAEVGKGNVVSINSTIPLLMRKELEALSRDNVMKLQKRINSDISEKINHLKILLKEFDFTKKPAFKDSKRDNIEDSKRDNIEDSKRDNIKDSNKYNIEDSKRDNIEDSKRDNIEDSNNKSLNNKSLNNIFSHRILNVDFYDKKNITKLISLISKTLSSAGVKGVIIVTWRSEDHFAINSDNNERLLVILNNKFKKSSFRIIKFVINGSVMFDENNLNLIQQALSNMMIN